MRIISALILGAIAAVGMVVRVLLLTVATAAMLFIGFLFWWPLYVYVYHYWMY